MSAIINRFNSHDYRSVVINMSNLYYYFVRLLVKCKKQQYKTVKRRKSRPKMIKKVLFLGDLF